MIASVIMCVIILAIFVGLFCLTGGEVLDPSAPPVEAIEEARRPSLASLQSGWTPQEREAFGINETEALIARIDKELG